MKREAPAKKSPLDELVDEGQRERCRHLLVVPPIRNARAFLSKRGELDAGRLARLRREVEGLIGRIEELVVETVRREADAAQGSLRATGAARRQAATSEIDQLVARAQDLDRVAAGKRLLLGGLLGELAAVANTLDAQRKKESERVHARAVAQREKEIERVLREARNHLRVAQEHYDLSAVELGRIALDFRGVLLTGGDAFTPLDNFLERELSKTLSSAGLRQRGFDVVGGIDSLGHLRILLELPAVVKREPQGKAATNGRAGHKHAREETEASCS